MPNHAKANGGELRLSTEQQKIRQGLMRIDKKASRAYEGALKVLEDSENPDRFSQAAHSLREVTTIISRRIALPQEATEENRLRQRLEKQLTQDPRLLPTPAENEARKLIRRWGELYHLFTAVSHHGKHVSEEEFLGILSESEALLLLFLKPIPEALEEIDSLLNIRSPTEENMRELVKLLNHPVRVEYLFSKLASPDWLMPLMEKGFFSKPPNGIPEGNYIMFPAWPQSTYLMKVAGHKPSEVMDIIKHLGETENYRAYIESITCALQMPSSIAKEIVPMIKKWMSTPYSHFVTDDLVRLAVKLKDEGEAESTFDLLDTLLEIKVSDADRAFRLKDCSPYLDLYQYKEILDRIVYPIARKEPRRVVQSLSGKLLKAIELERPSDSPSEDDFSFIWRPAIEDREQTDEDRYVKNVLVTAIRDCLEAIGKTDTEAFKDCYHLLSSSGRPIFRRLELHLMRMFPSILEHEINNTFDRKDVFEDTRVWHEYYHLLQERYPEFPQNLKAQILEWINDGPDLARLNAQFRERGKPRLTPEETAAYVARWQMSYLSALKDNMPPEWKRKWSDYVAKYGEVEHPDFHYYSGPVQIGSESPLTLTEVKTKSPTEIVDYLRIWKPSGDHFGPSKEGLGNTLREVISEDPSSYLEVMHEFEELAPVYICNLLAGYKKAAEKEIAFDWNVVLSFCKNVLAKPNLNINSSTEDIRLYDLESIKAMLADLLEEGLKSKKMPVPFQLRETAWGLIQVLLQDEEPSKATEKKYSEERKDLIFLSLNTVRGKAVHLVFHYALWCARCLNLSNNEEKLVPEVKEQLDKMLNPEVEPTETVRALYGLYLPNLFYLNKTWAEGHLSEIFPAEAEYRTLCRAAWTAYVTYCPVYDKIYQALRDQYKFATNKLDSSQFSREAKEKLSEHLLVAYLRGLEELDGDSLVRLSFERADSAVRRHAIWFVGKVLRDLQQNGIPAETKEAFTSRIISLWEWRMKEAKKANDKERMTFTEELKEFGMWFVYGGLDKTWTISQLVATLELTDGEIGFDNQIITRLSEYGTEHHLDVLKALNSLVKGDKKGVLLILSREKIKGLMENITTEHAAGEIKELMNELVDNLTRKRCFDFTKFFIKWERKGQAHESS